MFDIEELKSFKLPDLQQVAEQLKIDGYKKLKKGELLDAVLGFINKKIKLKIYLQKKRNRNANEFRIRKEKFNKKRLL